MTETYRIEHENRLAELAAAPATVDVSTACSYLGISKSHGYALLARGEFPCRVLQLGSRFRVVTASLVSVLTEPGFRENA